MSRTHHRHLIHSTPPTHPGGWADRAEPSLARLTAGRPVRLLGIWAHPDDEAYLSAGLMRRVIASGGTATCLTATYGEAGVPPDDPRPPAAVATLREAELRHALDVAGADLVPILGHPDGGCAEVPHEHGVAQARAALEAVRPHVVVTFGPDGITGHPDHRAVQRWVTDAWQQVGRGTLLYATMSDDFLARNRALHDRVGVFGDHEPVSVPAVDVALRIELDDCELDRKRRVLAAHASQTEGLAAAMGEDTYRTWWVDEDFRRPTDDEIAAAVDFASAPAVPVR